MMSFTDLERLLLALVAGAFVLLVCCVIALVRLGMRYRQREREFGKESRLRVEKSRSVLMGQVAEHMVPLLSGFPYHLKDARFMGQPVDYLVFKGLEESLQSGAPPGNMEVVFCEIKTGQSRLSAAELAIRDAVNKGRVRFEVLRLGSDGMLRKDPASP